MIDSRAMLYQAFETHLYPEVLAVIHLPTLKIASERISGPITIDEDWDLIVAQQGYVDDIVAISKSILNRKEAEVVSTEAGLELEARRAAAVSGIRLTDSAVKAQVQGTPSLAELKAKLSMLEVFCDHLKNIRFHILSRKEMTLERSYERRSLRNDKDK